MNVRLRTDLSHNCVQTYTVRYNRFLSIFFHSPIKQREEFQLLSSFTPFVSVVVPAFFHSVSNHVAVECFFASVCVYCQQNKRVLYVHVHREVKIHFAVVVLSNDQE